MADGGPVSLRGRDGSWTMAAPRAPRGRRVGSRIALIAGALVVFVGLTYVVTRPGPGAQDTVIAGVGGNDCGWPLGPGLDACNDAPRMPGGDIVVAVDRAPAGWNAGSARGAAASTAEEEAPLLPSAFVLRPSGKIAYNNDMLAAEPEVVGQDPAMVVYRINPHAVWNDGTGRTYPVTAQDFIYTWRSRDGHDRSLPVATTAGYDSISSIVGSDGDRTVTVTFDTPYADWRGLFSRLEPYWFAAARSGADPTDAAQIADPQLEIAFTALDTVPRFSAGPFMIDRVGPGGVTVEVPNPRWYGHLAPSLRSITFRPFAARDAVLAFLDKKLDAFRAEAGPDLVAQLSMMVDVGFQVAAGFSREHLQLNTTDPFLRDGTLRRAILAAIDVQDLIEATVKPFYPDAQQLYSHNLVPGETGYTDVIRQVDPAAGHDDLDAARKLLAGAGYTGIGAAGALKTPDGRHVTIAFAHTDTPVRDKSASLVAAYLGRLGITVTDRVTRDMTATLAHRDFGIAELDSAGTPLLGTTARLWGTGAAANYTGWGDPGSDVLLDQAAREMDAAKQAALLNRQDRILTAADVDLPLYRRPVVFASYERWVGLRANESGGFFTYNTQEWGLLRSAP